MTEMRIQTARVGIPSERIWSSSAYSRAIMIGDRIEIAGTSSASPSGEIRFPGDMYEQASYIFTVIKQAIHDLGGRMEDVVRTRVFTTDISRWQEIGAAHYEAFGHMETPPVSAFYGVKELLHPDMLLEIEASAIL